MRYLQKILITLAGLVWLLATAAHATELAGVKFDDAVQVGGTPLVLNGAGIRYKAIFKVYAMGMYLPRKTTSSDEALAMPGAKRLWLTMLREVDANELGKLFIRGVEDNSARSEMGRLIPGLVRMGQISSDQKRLMPGETFGFEYVPGHGTTVFVRGVPQGEPIKEPAFFTALTRVWLGASPADWQLKDALLGKPPRDPHAF